MIDLIRHSGVGVVGARLLYSNSDRLQHAGTIFGPRYGNMPYHFRHKEKSDKNAEINKELILISLEIWIGRLGPFSFKMEIIFSCVLLISIKILNGKD